MKFELLPVKFLDYELRDKSDQLEALILKLRDLYKEAAPASKYDKNKDQFQSAYRMAHDIAEHFDILKYNRDIMHEPNEKENKTKGF